MRVFSLVGGVDDVHNTNSGFALSEAQGLGEGSEQQYIRRPRRRKQSVKMKVTLSPCPERRWRSYRQTKTCVVSNLCQRLSRNARLHIISIVSFKRVGWVCIRTFLENFKNSTSLHNFPTVVVCALEYGDIIYRYYLKRINHLSR